MPEKEVFKIGLALSGGGLRAACFHLGCLQRLSEGDVIKDVNRIATVSGGSLAIGLLFSNNGMKWPTKMEFTDTLEKIKDLLLKTNVQRGVKWWSIRLPYRLLLTRANRLVNLISEEWGITQCLQALPDSPTWRILASTYETGKCWRFSKEKMGDYLAGYEMSPRLKLAVALASSAAVPGAIGLLNLPLENRKLDGGDSKFSKVRFWDGGLYDNLGMESMYKIGKGVIPDIDFLIVSDASKPIGFETRRFGRDVPFYLPMLRSFDIPTDQVRALRSREFFNYLKDHPHKGSYLRIGGTSDYIFSQAGKKLETNHREKCLNHDEIKTALDFDTTLRKLTSEEFDLLVRHGYENANATLNAYHPDRFGYLLYPQ